MLSSIWALTLNSCKKSDNKEKDVLDFKNFPKSYQLDSGQEVLSNDLGYAIAVVDTFILVKQRQNDLTNKVFNVYDLNLSFLGNIGSRGSGPSEFIGTGFSYQYLKEQNDISIVINDFPQSQISIVSLKESLKRDTTIIKKQIEYHPKYDFSSALFITNDGGIIGRQGGLGYKTNIYEIHILKNGQKELLSYGEYPTVANLDSQPSFEPETVNAGALTKHPIYDKYASALFYYDQLRIYDSNGQTLRTIKSSDFKEYSADKISSNNPQVNNLRIYNRSVISTSNFIYSLVYDQAKSDLDIEFIPVTIRVFDWDGNLKGILKCPDYLTNISVDEKNGYLYGDSFQEEGFKRYSIKEFLEDEKK